MEHQRFPATLLVLCILTSELLTSSNQQGYRQPNFASVTLSHGSKPYPPRRTTPTPTWLPPDITTTTPTPHALLRMPPHRQKEVTLTFTNVGLRRVGPDFIKSPEFIHLNLDKNKIETISVLAFRRAPLLQSLSLSDNKIPVNKLLSFGHVTNLWTLTVDNSNGTNEDWELTEYPETMPRLRKLSLQGNSIKTFGVDLKNLAPTLTQLNLFNNSLTSTDFLCNIPETLTHLHLGHNLIREIEPDVLENISDLDLQSNQIERLCSETCTLPLGKATKLQRLDVSANKITEISADAFDRLQHLTYLSLSNNDIEHLLEGTFTRQGQLEELLLSHNKLEQIPELCQLRRLKTLDMGHNRIAEVNGEQLCRSTALKKLLLNNNRITSIRTLQLESSLEMLDLSNNHLIELTPNWIGPSASPRVLLLNDNNITEWKKLPLSSDMSRMAELHLEGNPFTFVTANVLCSYPQKLLVHLKRAPVEDDDKVDLEEQDDSSFNNAIDNWL